MSDVLRNLKSFVSTIQSVVLTADIFQLSIMYEKLIFFAVAVAPQSEYLAKEDASYRSHHVSFRPSFSGQRPKTGIPGPFRPKTGTF